VGLRTTGVRLVAEYREYKRGIKEAQKSTSEFREEVADTRTESDKLGEQLAKTGRSAKGSVDEMRKTVAGLDKQIQEAQQNAKDLARQYAAGDKGALKALNEQKRTLTELKSVRSLLPDAAELAAAGMGIGAKVLGGIKGAFTAAEPAAIGLPALGLLMAPTLGAAVAGAVVGGIGIGGVVGGITLAARDQRVKDAGQDLGRFLLGDLSNRAGREFVEPTLKGIQRIRQGWQEMGPDLDKIFASSRFVEPLADGVIKGAKGIVSGVAAAIEDADPVVQSFSILFGAIGESTGDLFRSMAQDADEGASAIDDVTLSISNMITATGGFLHGTAQVKGFGDSLDTLIDRGRYWVETMNNSGTKLSEWGVQLDITADGFQAGSQEAEAYAAAVMGTATACEFATLKAAGMTDAEIAAADSSGTYRVELERLAEAARFTAEQMGTLTATEKDVQAVQKEATLAQTDYNKSIELMAPQAQRATMLVQGLQKATQALYGAQEAGIEANESYEASWDALSGAVKGNKGSLDSHTEAGRKNRDALQELLKSSRELYFADVASGRSTDEAAAAHKRRTEAVRKEAIRVGLNKTETDKLIGSYGRIPPKKETQIIQDGVDNVVKKMMDLYVYQRSLAEGLPIGTVRAMLKDEKGPAKRYGGYHDGGHTGPGGEHEPAGIVHRDEFVIKKKSRRKIEARQPGLLDEMNATGQVPGYAKGGWVGAFPVETRDYRVSVTGDRTKVPSREQVAAKVAPKFGDWPSSPSAQRGDSGVWKQVVRLIKSGPKMGSFGNAYRPGDPKWHGSGRAVDWMGYNMDPLAQFLASKKPLELIHRTSKRDYAYTRGRNKGSFDESLMNAHRNHIHIAMANGGEIREPIFGVGASGRTYSMGENYRPERVVPMGGSTTAAAAGRTTVVHLNVNVARGVNRVEAGREIADALTPFLAAGGSVVVRGQTVLAAS
jgi:hypothetical protein